VTQTWNPLRTWWNHVMRVLLVALVLCASACTGPGRSTSEPSAMPPDGGYAGMTNSEKGDSDSGM
jgi:hypothetical protein